MVRQMAWDFQTDATLKDYQPHKGRFPSGHLPTKREDARARYAELIEHAVGNS